MNEDDASLYAEALVGKDAEEFLKSDIGRLLLARAEEEEKEAMEELAKVSPWRRRRIRELQNRVWRARSVVGWLVEVVNAGKQALATLDSRET